MNKSNSDYSLFLLLFSVRVKILETFLPHYGLIYFLVSCLKIHRDLVSRRNNNGDGIQSIRSFVSEQLFARNFARTRIYILVTIDSINSLAVCSAILCGKRSRVMSP